MDFNKLYGTYGGLIEPLSLTFAQSGSVSFSVNTNRTFTGKVDIGGVSASVSGTFATDGTYSGSVSGTAYSLGIQIDPANTAGKFTGSVTQSGSKVANVTANRRPIWSTSNPCPRAGNYTVALPADPSHPETSYPQGTGFGLITVSPTGSVWLTGVLGDQTEVSAGANISVNGEVPFYTTAYNSKGGITGWMTLRDSTASNQVSGRSSASA